MSNNFTIDQLTKSQTIDPNSINRLYKLNMMLNFMDIRSNNPRMTQKQICKELGTSDSTIKRYRDDIQMDSPYNRSIYKKKTPKQKPSIATKNISKNENNKPTSNKRSKNNAIKGGNASNTHTISNKELIDYAFESGKANSILENKPEDNTKFITIARKMVNNS